MPGYRATKQADGTWSIHDVPIFANCERTLTTSSGKSVALKVDRVWQERAVDVARGKFANAGYQHPLFADSHEQGKRRRVGTFLPTKVVEMGVGLERKDATLCDYNGLSDEDFAAFKSGRFPYASAEFLHSPGRTPEIQGVALVTERPFHEFPIQRIGSEVSDPARAEGVLAFHAFDETASVLVRFAMPDDPNAAKPAAPATDPAAAPKPDAKPEGEGAMAAVSTKLDAIFAALTKLLGGALGSPDATKPAPVVGAAFGADGKPLPATAPDAATLATFQADLARKDDEIKALKTKDAARDAAEAKRVAVAGAVERLKGFDVGSDPLALCTAKFEAGGKAALDAFVDGRILAGDREPDAAWAAGERSGDIDPLVAKFGADNADMVSTLSHEFDALKVGEAVKGVSREAHVRVGLVRAGRLTAAAAYGPSTK